MSKKIHIAALAAALLLLGCGHGGKRGAAEAKAAKPVEIGWQEGDACAVAFLGYYEDYQGLRESAAYETLCRQYPQLKGLGELAVAADGEELYLIIPRDPMATVTVQAYSYGAFIGSKEAGDEPILYKSDEGAPLLVRCNESDATPNTQVTVVGEGGSLVGYSPRIDINQGCVATQQGVRDASPAKTLPQAEPTKYAMTDYNGERHTFLTVAIKNGAPMVRFERAMLEYYTSLEERARRSDDFSQWHRVTGLNGIAQQAFVGDIGQDAYPVLMVRTTDGKAHMMALPSRILDNDMRISTPMPGMDDIRGFEEGPGGGWVDENGDTNYEYRTIYALDAKGKRHEVAMFENSLPPLSAKTEGKNLYMSFKLDNRMDLLYDDNNYASGFFFDNERLVGTPDNNYAAEYDFNLTLQDGKHAKGTFRLAINHDNASEVFFTLLSGNLFGLKKGKTITLRDSM